MRFARIVFFAAVLLQPALSFAFNKPFRWTSNTSPIYPVVRIVGCPNHFNTNFPGFDWGRVPTRRATRPTPGSPRAGPTCGRATWAICPPAIGAA